ncbi:hypothetical protein BGZ58_003077 [Dissophora ornata]|nr:hypothetical protein BGZ58_003077 [Dissophora ornata]
MASFTGADIFLFVIGFFLPPLNRDDPNAGTRNRGRTYIAVPQQTYQAAPAYQTAPRPVN